MPKTKTKITKVRGETNVLWYYLRIYRWKWGDCI